MPVLLILLANSALFLMAAFLLWKHGLKKSGGEVNLRLVRNWLLALVSLLTVMGFTWVVGLLVVLVRELVTLAYIFTLSMAFQGLWIFLVLVVAQKQVREEIWNTCVSNCGENFYFRGTCLGLGIF